jgi:hypothetical protein
MPLIVLCAWIQRNYEVHGHALAGVPAHQKGKAQLVNICYPLRSVITRAKTKATKTGIEK